MTQRLKFMRGDVELSSSHGLPSKKAQVFQLAAAGKQAKEIAREMGVSPETVNWHLNALKEQFGAINRADLISQGWMHGILQARNAVAAIALALCVLSALPMTRTRVQRPRQPRPVASRQIGRREIPALYA